jgi:hypothetical protein
MSKSDIESQSVIVLNIIATSPGTEMHDNELAISV